MFRSGLRFLFRALEVPESRVRKRPFHWGITKLLNSLAFGKFFDWVSAFFGVGRKSSSRSSLEEDERLFSLFLIVFRRKIYKSFDLLLFGVGEMKSTDNLLYEWWSVNEIFCGQEKFHATQPKMISIQCQTWSSLFSVLLPTERSSCQTILQYLQRQCFH